jgi:hypothetical protein
VGCADVEASSQRGYALTTDEGCQLRKRGEIMTTLGFRVLSTLLMCCALTVLTGIAVAEDYYSPPANRDYPTTVYWGDTHLHTNMSVDANGMGDRALSPDDALRFARGEAIRAHNGELVKLRRPLDFLMVADHAVNLGVLPRIQRLDPLIMKTELGQEWARLLKENPIPTGEILNADSPEPRREAARSISSTAGLPAGFFWRAWTTDYVADETFRHSVWEEVCANAERYNEPGKFTAFIGYEWTPSTQDPRSPNFHRNVVFKDGPDRVSQVLPFSVQDSTNVEDLWAYLDNYEATVGGKVLAIPHNGNLSSGKMFLPIDFNGDPITADYARTRARWEPLYEVTQYKGDAETHPVVSPNDEFADFETWNVPGFFGEKPEDFAEQKRYEYARSALMVGLEQKDSLEVNPFKFGMIGSTDAHTSLSTVDENNFWGKISLNEASPYRAESSWYFSAAGMAAVWATENTRAALFEAMQRRETYATTGPRMVVRFFGGWNFRDGDALRHDFVDIGYDKGVPMGGDLYDAPAGVAPSFLIRVLKDPDGANLDRVQVIKGWRDADGSLQEKIYDVALSDGRKPDADGRVEPVGSTVDVANASYTNTIGDPELAVVWHDPDFDRGELAFYYVRVLEIPTPRWTAYDAKHYGLEDLPDEIPMVTQDRAYTSPIWYTP